MVPIDKYIPLFPSGWQQAVEMNYIDRHDPPNGSLCLECGALVASRWLHDNYHVVQDKEEN